MLHRVRPPAGPAGVLATAMLIGAVGDGAYLVTSVLYFTRVVGLSAEQIGLGLTVSWALGFLAGTPLGNLADRRGPRGTAALLALVTAGSLGALLLARTFPVFLLATCGYAAGQCGLGAARQALLAALVAPAERTRVRAYLQSTANAGLAVGAGLGGLALRFDTAPAYLAVLGADALAVAVCALLLLRLPVVPPAPARTSGEPRLAVLRDRPYAVLALLNAVLLLRMPVLSLLLPLWVVQRTGAPKWLVAALFVLNTLGVVAGQVRIARLVTDLASATRVVRWAGLVLLAACAVLAASGQPSPWLASALLVASGVLLVIGEMMQSSGNWEISFGLAPADKQGQYQGFYDTGTAVARMLGPLLLTTLVLGGGPVGWLVLGAAFALAGAATGPAVRWAARTRPASPEPEPTAAPA